MATTTLSKFKRTIVFVKAIMTSTPGIHAFVPAILLTTTESENEAITISNKLVQEKLAACVQIK